MSVEQAQITATPRSGRSLSLRGRDRILSIASPLGLLLLWELAARFGFIDTRFFPAPYWAARLIAPSSGSWASSNIFRASGNGPTIHASAIWRRWPKALGWNSAKTLAIG